MTSEGDADLGGTKRNEAAEENSIAKPEQPAASAGAELPAASTTPKKKVGEPLRRKPALPDWAEPPKWMRNLADEQRLLQQMADERAAIRGGLGAEVMREAQDRSGRDRRAQEKLLTEMARPGRQRNSCEI